MRITKIKAKEILDSRGRPTLEVTAFAGDIKASFGVPSGASKGKYEARELRDRTKEFLGFGVKKAKKNIEKIIAPKLKGKDIFEQKKIDDILLKLDGSKNKKNLGANAIIGTSGAILKLAAKIKNKSLWQYIAEKYNFKPQMPFLVMNFVNGGKHADSPLAFQEYQIILKTKKSVYKALNNAYLVFKNLERQIKKEKINTFGVGDEGGYVLPLKDNEKPLSFLLAAIKSTGLKNSKNVFLGLDIAASSFYKKNKYILTTKTITKIQMLNYVFGLAKKYDLFYLEDPFEENDFETFKTLKEKLLSTGKKTLIVGDDLTVTNASRIKKAIQKNAISAVLIKPNQIGTITETIEAIKLAKSNSLKTIISHRSGETNDDFIADLAVGTSSEGLKAGSICRGERLAKYNRLLKIEKELKF